MRIKRITPSSVGRIFGAMYLAIGIVFGIVVLIPVLFGSSGSVALAIGVVVALLIPIFYGAIGYVAGLFSAWLYNVIAKKVGGIEIETEE